MSQHKNEKIVALFFAACLITLFVWVIFSSQVVRESDNLNGYEVKARFDNVGGLNTSSPVKAAGVQIGRVIAIEYDATAYEAVVTLTIESQYDKFPIDTAASVLSSGLMGNQYISLQPGAEAEFLVSGSEIDLTQSALVWEQIIGQFLYNQSNE